MRIKLRCFLTNFVFSLQWSIKWNLATTTILMSITIIINTECDFSHILNKQIIISHRLVVVLFWQTELIVIIISLIIGSFIICGMVAGKNPLPKCIHLYDSYTTILKRWRSANGGIRKCLFVSRPNCFTVYLFIFFFFGWGTFVLILK